MNPMKRAFTSPFIEEMALLRREKLILYIFLNIEQIREKVNFFDE
jgi:hypothetical protein